MAKNKSKEVKPDAELGAVEQAPQSVTVGTGVYKPLPRFRGGCPNC